MNRELPRRLRRLAMTTIFLFAAFNASADECVVKTASQLESSVDKAMNGGSCKTDLAEYRNKYDEYRNNAIEFHVIRFKGSGNFEANLPCLHGQSGMPLILIADAELKVVLSGDSLCIDGAQGNVIVDGIEFKTPRFEVKSNGNAILNSHITGNIIINGNSNYVVESYVSESQNNGIEIKGDDNKIIKTEIGKNTEHGVYINGYRTEISGGKIYKNAKSGVYVDSCPDEECKNLRTALITRTEFAGNGENAISIDKWPLPPPQNLVSVGAGSEWKVTGNIGKMEGPWKTFNIKKAHIELFIKDGPFVAETDKIDPATGEFIFSLQKPLIIGEAEFAAPIFTATLVDHENSATSPFAEPLDVLSKSDWDNDGIMNNDEDYNLNGTVDFGETDPRNADTDGDGLTDGEERLHLGRIKELMDKGMIFSDLTKLNPTNRDSDGDCLNDGMELAVIMAEPGSSRLQPAPTERTLKGATPLMKLLLLNEPFSPYCKSILKQHNVITVANGDADISTTTDPTNSDTDSDGLLDGEEDWNFNGKRDESRATSHEPLFLESDPNLPDSDGDSFLDGSEGDTNKNGMLDEGETDVLLKDTDGDGLTDDEEILRFGSMPNKCDSDSDGLPDGIEGGAINPNQEKPECSGLQTAGTNFASIDLLSPTKTDSDGDGISDGEEDTNHNGWLDINETDPTTADTDNDGISDGIEVILDADKDGFSDINIANISNGKKCSPPENVNDIDCDGIVNARDADSDNDGCSDLDEGINKDKDANGILDIWEQAKASCSDSANGNGAGLGGTGGGATGGTGGGNNSGAESPAENVDLGTVDSKGGGGCSLCSHSRARLLTPERSDGGQESGSPVILLVFLVFGVAGFSLRQRFSN